VGLQGTIAGAKAGILVGSLRAEGIGWMMLRFAPTTRALSA
jgi:hypothetical protein